MGCGCHYEIKANVNDHKNDPDGLKEIIKISLNIYIDKLEIDSFLNRSINNNSKEKNYCLVNKFWSLSPNCFSLWLNTTLSSQNSN